MLRLSPYCARNTPMKVYGSVKNTDFTRTSSVTCEKYAALLERKAVEEIRIQDYEREQRRKTALQLHYLTLAEYHKVQRIHRGLRTNLRPTLFQDNPEFCQKFKGILNKCSMDIILLTIEYLQKEISELETRIIATQLQLSNTLNPENFNNIKLKMDKTSTSNYRIRKDNRFSVMRKTFHAIRFTDGGIRIWENLNIQR
ncbi:unnamed protein product [Ranitomeya imitator]|uniref:Uncharacterized protein n=1 Tax=Ranitomeya imitator TaxID=111125 RepID=A0ABN9KXG7_9NEOB|nr:unnamed protein product [Ranitomeya imitator]